MLSSISWILFFIAFSWRFNISVISSNVELPEASEIIEPNSAGSGSNHWKVYIVMSSILFLISVEIGGS